MRYGVAMKSTDETKFQAAIDVADAILAEFNDSGSRLKGFASASIEKILIYEKIVQKLSKAKAKLSG